MPTRGRPIQKSRALHWFGRLVTVLEREGLRGSLRRKLSQLLGYFAERARLWRMRGVPGEPTIVPFSS